MLVPTFISVIVSLFIIEVLLSVDNALVNVTLANALPESERKRAIQIGIALGAVFRIIALFTIAFIIQNTWIKLAGALYLIYLAIYHLGRAVDEKGDLQPVGTSFRAVIFQIAVADIVFSIDNVISAVAFSPRIELVIIGVLIGIISMIFITPLLSSIVHRYRGMPQAAYTIVGIVGVLLIIETLMHIHIDEYKKFLAVISIVIFTIIYEHSVIVRVISNPILKKLQYLIAIPLDMFYVIKNAFTSVPKNV